MKRILAGFAAVGFLACLTACGMTHSVLPSPPRPAAAGASRQAVPTNPLIQHVVIIVQENRTPDNLFNGLPGADTAQTGRRLDRTVVSLAPVGLVSGDVAHTHQDFLASYHNGALDGFDLESFNHHRSADLPYAYVPRSETQPYWQLAQQYTFGDRMFQSNTGPSFPAHQYLIAGQSNFADNNPGHSPWGCDASSNDRVSRLGSNGQQISSVFPCFDYPTLADEMDANHVTWRYYAPSVGIQGSNWSAFDAIRHIRFGADWSTSVVSPETKILQDVANLQLDQVTWVVPSARSSDHSGIDDGSGPDWVASVVNAIGNSPFWSTTAIFIVWDDWGGWYDHVSPPQLDVMGLGYRVPLIVVSPYAKAGYVSHVQYEFGSLLKFSEETFGLPSLGTTDARANDLSDCFNFTQLPRTFSPVVTRVKPADFIMRPRDLQSPDL